MNSYKFMRILLFFDLPSVTYKDLKQYRNFRKWIYDASRVGVCEIIIKFKYG